MAIERCNRCERFVDLDWHVEDIEYLDKEGAVCTNCLTDDELAAIEAKKDKEENQ